MTLLALISETLTEINERDGSDEIYNLLLPYSGQFVVAGWGIACSGSVDHFLGLLAHNVRHQELAVKHFSAAIEQESRLRAPALLADTLYWRARAQLSCDPRLDQERQDGIACLERSFQIADQCGLPRLLRRISELKSMHGLA
jgi:hypothetical protein